MKQARIRPMVAMEMVKVQGLLLTNFMLMNLATSRSVKPDLFRA